MNIRNFQGYQPPIPGRTNRPWVVAQVPESGNALVPDVTDAAHHTFAFATGRHIPQTGTRLTTLARVQSCAGNPQ